MRIAVLVKQIPAPEQLRFEGTRLARLGVDLEVSAYCRRANAKAVELAGEDGEVVVFTMGPPSAEDALREMLACGATRAVHLCDPAFAGADTLATARALAAAIRTEGPFDLILVGVNSLDADTGQVGPELAELLGLPFVGPARELTVGAGSAVARQETHDGHRTVRVALPAVVSTAERLCDPSKAKPEERVLVDAGLIRCVGRADLGLGPEDVGEAGSPTHVGPVRVEEVARHRRQVDTAAEAVAALEELGAFDEDSASVVRAVVPEAGGTGPAVWCFVEPGGDRANDELLGEAAALAAVLGGSVTAVTPAPVPTGLGAKGADRILVVPGDHHPERWASALGAAAARELPWALLVGSTRAGRTVASIVAARNGWGLTGDAIGIEVAADGRMLAWKPAFGGRLVAPIESDSPVQMATVRPGVLHARRPRAERDPAVEELPDGPAPRISIRSIERDDDAAIDLLEADRVIGIGTGIEPADYHLLEPLRQVLGGAPVAATRRVTDKGWMPHSRQVGITGHYIAPRLYVALGLSGRFNHMVGVRKAATVLAINADPEALVFDHCDVGIVGDWRTVLPELVHALGARRLEPASVGE